MSLLLLSILVQDFLMHMVLLTGKEHILSQLIERYLNPVWEVTNVFLVFFFVGIIGFFPQTAYYYGTTLLVPVSIGIDFVSHSWFVLCFYNVWWLKAKNIYVFVWSFGFIYSCITIHCSYHFRRWICEDGRYKSCT